MKKTRNKFIKHLCYLCLAGVIALGLITTIGTGGGGGGGSIEETNEITEQAQKILDVLSEGDDYYNDLVAQDDPSPLQKTVDWLKTQSNVEDAALGQDGVSIWIRYDSGVEGIILTESFKSLSGTTSFQASSEWFFQLKDNISSISTTNKKAIILLPIDSVPAYKDQSADDIAAYLQQSGFSVEIYQDEEVTVDLMKTTPNYSFVYMATHGGVGLIGSGLGWNVQIMTGQVANTSTMASFWNLLKAGKTSGLTIFIPPKTKTTYFGLNKNFFDDYTYPGTFVYMNACSSFKNDSLADAFLNNGASIFLGWDNTSFLYLSNSHNPEFFQELAIEGNTFEQAYNDTIADYYPATVYKDDNGNGNYHVLLLNGDDLGDIIDDTTFDYSLSLKYKGDSEYVLNSTDTTPPSAPENLTATAVSSSQIDLSWDASTDDVAVAGYKVYREATYLKSVTTISTSDTGLDPDTQYCYTVSAYDAAGNESIQSNEACATTSSVATTPPTAIITSPSDGATFTEGDEITFTGTGTDPEDGELTGNYLIWTSDKDGQIGIGQSFSTGTLTVNTHTVTLTATDYDGGIGTDTITISVVQLVPALISVSPLNGATDVPPNFRIVSWTFSKPMATGYSIYWDGLGPADQVGTFSHEWSADNRTFSMTYSQDWPSNSTISWTLNSSTYCPPGCFADLDGNYLPTVSGEFTTSEMLIEVGCFSSHFHDGYYVQLYASDPNLAADSISITGPGLYAPLTLSFEAYHPNEWWSVPNVSLGPEPEQLPPLTYTFNIESNGDVYSLDCVVYSLVDQFATDLSPSGGETVWGNLTFTWTGISIPTVEYQVQLFDDNWNGIWNSPKTTGNSVDYTEPPLSYWSTYRYFVTAFDTYGNQSHAYAEFGYGPP